MYKTYKKIILLLIAICVSIPFFSTCDMSSQKDNDGIMKKEKFELYNSYNEKVAESNGSKKAKEMLTFLKWQVKSVMSTKGDEDYDENYDKNYNDFLREVPKGTKIDYRIVITVKGLIKKNVSKISEIEYCFYKDYPYVVIKNIPVVDYYVWKISKQELKKLQEMFRKIEGV